MMKHFLLLTVSIIAMWHSTQTGYAQGKQSSLVINVGHVQNKEENLHPKVFRGINLGASYSYTSFGRNISEYDAGIILTALNTSYEGFPSAPGIALAGSYKHLFTALQQTHWHLSAGPAATMKYGVDFYPNWDESHLYYASHISAGISSRLSYTPQKHHLIFHIDIPVASFISRPPNNRQYKYDDLTFTGIARDIVRHAEPALYSKHFFIQTKAEYCFGKRKNLFLGYNLHYLYMRANGGLPFQNVTHAISYRYILKP